MSIGYARVQVDVDHLGVRSYRFDFPDGPWESDAMALDAMVRDGHAIRRGPYLAIGGRAFILVPRDQPWLMPGFIAYPTTDWRAYVALGVFHVDRYFSPLRQWIAFQCYYAGWLRQGDSARWRDLMRVILDHTTAGPARA